MSRVVRVWLRPSPLTAPVSAAIVVQVRIMASLSHPNVVRYFDSFLDEGKLNIIMEFCDQGDLQQYLKRRTRDRESVAEDDIWRIFLQIAAGLHYLHMQRVLHRDMKSANVFMCKVCTRLGSRGLQPCALSPKRVCGRCAGRFREDRRPRRCPRAGHQHELCAHKCGHAVLPLPRAV